MRFVLFLTIMLICGCVEAEKPFVEVREKVVGAPGLKILNFGPLMSRVESGDTFELILEIENTGDRPARRVRAELFRLGEITPVGGGAEEIPELEGQIPGIPGEEREITWTLRAPEIGAEDVELERVIGVKLKYDYDSVKYQSLQTVSREKWKKRDVKVVSWQDSSLSPINIELLFPQPLVIRDREEFALVVKLTNILEGRVNSRKDVPSDSWCRGEKLDCIDLVKLEIPEDFRVGEDCDFVDGVKEYVKLTEDTATLFCDLEHVGTEKENVYRIGVSATYTYEQDANTRVTIYTKG